MHKQTGMGFVELIIFSSFIIVVGYLGMRVVPAYMEFMAIEKALEDTVAQPSIDKPSERDLRERFAKLLDVNGVTRVTSRDMVIDYVAGQRILSLEYTRCDPLVGPAKLCFDFKPHASGKMD